VSLWLDGDNIRSHAEGKREKAEADEQDGESLAGKSEYATGAQLK
jgi:hypothetical protein